MFLMKGVIVTSPALHQEVQVSRMSPLSRWCKFSFKTVQKSFPLAGFLTRLMSGEKDLQSYSLKASV